MPRSRTESTKECFTSAIRIHDKTAAVLPDRRFVGVDGTDAGGILSHPARNVNTSDLLPAAAGIEIKEANFIGCILIAEGFIGRRDIDENFAALARFEQVAEDVAIGEALAGLFGAEGAPVER